jgi:hypothetical protein
VSKKNQTEGVPLPILDLLSLPLIEKIFGGVSGCEDFKVSKEGLRIKRLWITYEIKYCSLLDAN